MHVVVHCKNMYDVQLSSKILFSQLHVRSFKSFGQLLNGSSSKAYTVCVSLAYSTIFYP